MRTKLILAAAIAAFSLGAAAQAAPSSGLTTLGGVSTHDEKILVEARRGYYDGGHHRERRRPICTLNALGLLVC